MSQRKKDGVELILDRPEELTEEAVKKMVERMYEALTGKKEKVTSTRKLPK